MGEEKRIRGKPFGPENPPPGKGRPKLSPENKGVQRLHLDEFLSLTRKYMAMTRGELEKAAQDKTLAVLDLMIVAVIVQAFKKGDVRNIEFMLERHIGKAPLKIINEHSGPGGAPIQVAPAKIDYSKLTKEEVETLDRIVRKALITD